VIELTTAEIAELTHGESDADGTATGVTVDSRTVTAGDLFVGLPGERSDGAAFADQALTAGAVAALVPRGYEGEGRIAVDDPLDALGVIAREVRLRSSAEVVGITGSTGKTSTKDILAALVAPHREVVASRQNENNELGVPLTLARIESTSRVAVVEMAMRGIGQIAHLAAIARPRIAIVTGVGPVHLELLGTIEQVAQAKAELLEALPPDGVAIVPYAEPLLERHVARLQCDVVTFGTESGADVRMVSFTAAEGWGQAEIELRGRTLTLPVNFTARHNAINLAAAAAAYDAIGLPLEGIGRGAADVVFSRWRGEEVELPGGGLLIADCYNANPTSMRAALRHLTDLAGGRRRVAVLGDMAELGEGARAYHREIGALLDQLGVEVVLAVGGQARAYGGSWFATAGEAGDALAGLLQPGDAVLVKASRSVGLERVVEAVAP
jgi:UDP-N-acetylmuramoyl-tripeptide--D-alanyl-D-alanine ligase